MTDPDDGSAAARFAAVAGVPVPAPGDRVRSLRFTRGAEEWTATVGARLTGRLAARTDRRAPRRSARSGSAPTRDVSDPATVQAILPDGDGYVVVTDAPPVGTVDDSTVENPLRVAGHDVREVGRYAGRLV